MQVQASSHRVESSDEWSVGNIRSGSVQLKPLSRHVAAC
jgi:hypothetical protein